MRKGRFFHKLILIHRPLGRRALCIRVVVYLDCSALEFHVFLKPERICCAAQLWKGPQSFCRPQWLETSFIWILAKNSPGNTVCLQWSDLLLQIF